tara:strand:- start:12 stop:392 length:381 start_codon:yes stop_codon:yes gene_type:complete
MNIHRANPEISDSVEAIKNALLELSDHCNEDLTIRLRGYVHNQTGFILQALNVERLTDETLSRWKGIVAEHGYDCDIRYVFSEGHIDIKCTDRERRGCRPKASHLLALVYLSVAVGCIYLLWIRQM